MCHSSAKPSLIRLTFMVQHIFTLSNSSLLTIHPYFQPIRTLDFVWAGQLVCWPVSQSAGRSEIAIYGGRSRALKIQNFLLDSTLSEIPHIIVGI